MGNRGNVVVVQPTRVDPEAAVYLYTHWSGSYLPGIVQKALARGKDRWRDEAYLTRILFSQMLNGDVEGTTGFGISTVMGDGGCEVYIDPDSQRVTIEGRSWSFDEFIALDKQTLDKVWNNEEDEE